MIHNHCFQGLWPLYKVLFPPSWFTACFSGRLKATSSKGTRRFRKENSFSPSLGSEDSFEAHSSGGKERSLPFIATESPLSASCIQMWKARVPKYCIAWTWAEQSKGKMTHILSLSPHCNCAAICSEPSKRHGREVEPCKKTTALDTIHLRANTPLEMCA